jgi:hypothetical protein
MQVHARARLTGPGMDILEGGSGSDRLRAGAGEDVLIGGAGAGDSCVGGAPQPDPDRGHGDAAEIRSCERMRLTFRIGRILLTTAQPTETGRSH